VSWHEQVYQAVLGPGDVKNYFVIAGAYRTKTEAVDAAAAMARKGFRPEIFSPPQKDDPYTVVLGEHLTYPDATHLAGQAVKARLPEWTYVWTFGMPLKKPVDVQFTLFQRQWTRLPESVGPNLWAYLTDVSSGSRDFRLYVVAAANAWPVDKQGISEKQFQQRIAGLPYSVAVYANKVGSTRVALEEKEYLVTARKIRFGGNEKVEFDLIRLL